MSVIKRLFSNSIIYSECYGPEYRGIEEVLKWFTDWNEKGRVLIWNIKDMIIKDSMASVEWYFKCDYEGVVYEFDGVSLIEFDGSGLITSIKEFQSKLPHYYPYKDL